MSAVGRARRGEQRRLDRGIPFWDDGTREESDMGTHFQSLPLLLRNIDECDKQWRCHRRPEMQHTSEVLLKREGCRGPFGLLLLTSLTAILTIV